MRILFNLVNCGLDNNGGSQSIVRMADALAELGNDVKIISEKQNRLTWFKPDNDIIDIKKEYNDPNKWPECDILVATGCSTVKKTMEYDGVGLDRKFYWIRAIETWAQPLESLFNGYKSGLTLLVNSEWQKRFIFAHTGISPTIQYCGIGKPFIDNAYKYLDNMSVNIKIDKIKLGALYSHKKRKRFVDVIEISKVLSKKGMLDELILFGTEDTPKIDPNIPINFTYYVRPSIDVKIRMFNEIDVWLATSDNEGLHIPPMEAGLCQANIVVRGLEASGMLDYAIDNYTAKLFLTNEEAIKCIIEYADNYEERIGHICNLRKLLLNKIGDVNENAKKFYKILEER